MPAGSICTKCGSITGSISEGTAVYFLWTAILCTTVLKKEEMIMAPKKKPKELKRRNNITVKLTDIELELLKQKAEMAGTSKAGYLRNLIIGTPMKVRYEIVADM